MENRAKRICIDLTGNSESPKTPRCPNGHCSASHDNCITKYFITKNGPSKPVNTIPKLFDNPKKKQHIKKEVVNLVEDQTDDNPKDIQVIVFDEKFDNHKEEQHVKENVVNHVENQTNNNPKDMKDQTNDNPEDVQVIVFDEKYDDPGTWPFSLTSLEIDYIVDKGPIKHSIDFPKDDRKRCFSVDLYTFKSVDRPWIVYSKDKDAAFCFCCKLFSNNKEDKLINPGVRDWRYIRSTLISHNKAVYHVNSVLAWCDRLIEVKNAKPKIDQNVIVL